MSPELLDDVRWHALTGEDVLERLETTTDGLASDEVPKRQERFGRNLLPAPEPPGVLEILLHQFKSPLIYILLVAGAVALLVGEGVDAAFIMAVLVLNAGIGTWQEWKAEKSAAGLQKLLVVQAQGPTGWEGGDPFGRGVGSRRRGQSGVGKSGSGRSPNPPGS
jgi:P-type Ca2+ transporter type 2C